MGAHARMEVLAMFTVVLGSAAVNDLLTESAGQVGGIDVPAPFVLGVCVLTIGAVFRTALVIRPDAFRSVTPLLRTIVLVLLTLVVMAAIVTVTPDGGPAVSPGRADRAQPGG
jgi:hypothetical protein